MMGEMSLDETDEWNVVYGYDTYGQTAMDSKLFHVRGMFRNRGL